MDTTAAPLDMASIMAKIAEMQAERVAENRSTRAALHAELSALGIDRVEADYDAYGDSGNVEDIRLLQAPSPGLESLNTTGAAAPDDIDWQISPKSLPNESLTRLQDFAWTTVYCLHPGFENNDGAYGNLVWDIAEDRICIDHNERFTDVNSYSHEDV